MMKFKTTRFKRIWQGFVLVACLGGIIAMLEYGSQLNQRNYQMLGEQTQTLSRMLVRQAAETAVDDLIDKNQDKLQVLVQRLSNDPLILDATIYDLEGRTVARTEEAMPVEQVTGLSTPLSVASYGRQQIIEPVLSSNQVIGFLRITLEHGKLVEHATNEIEGMTNIVRGLVIAALFIGFLLAMTFARRKDMWHSPFLLTANAKD